MTQELRLPSTDAIKIAAEKIHMQMDDADLAESYELSLIRLQPLSWPVRLDYDAPLRVAQLVIDLGTAKPDVFKMVRSICWAMAADEDHPETQRMGLTVLFAIKKARTLFPKPTALEEEIERGVKLLGLKESSESKSAAELGDEAGDLVMGWFDWLKNKGAKEPSKRFLTWAAEKIYTPAE
ncbi:MAG: hypothetical protein C3F12_04620 [Candidatus Methylomirabilota bacterium]|nr:hypothetical protein [candidate division NC10 bacterium]PWB47264.1 MAG: hypothetical protein C3F12_04620 [candidate division NC10 bacterium]